MENSVKNEGFNLVKSSIKVDSFESLAESLNWYNSGQSHKVEFSDGLFRYKIDNNMYSNGYQPLSNIIDLVKRVN